MATVSEERGPSSDALADVLSEFTPGALLTQVRRIWPQLLWVYIPGFLVLAFLFCVWAFTDLDIAKFTLDPLSAIERMIIKARVPGSDQFVLRDPIIPVPSYLGAVSNLGMVIWTIGAGVGFFAFSVLRRIDGQRAWARFFAWIGTLSAVIMLDDLYLIHERWFPHYTGMKENNVFAVYIVALAALCFLQRRQILRTDFFLLLQAGVLFAISILADKASFRVPQLLFFEDGAKFVGILSWTVYIFWTAQQQLTRAHAAPGTSHEDDASAGFANGQ